jgi:hypothetical protein
MKKTIGDLMHIREDLRVIFAKELPIQTAWRISKFISQIEREYEDFENTRLKALNKYLPEDAEKMTEEDEQTFKKELEKLLEIEVEIELDPIPIDELGDIKISPMSMAKMSFLFV